MTIINKKAAFCGKKEKKKMKKVFCKIISALVCLVLAFGFVACGEEGSGSTDSLVGTWGLYQVFDETMYEIGDNYLWDGHRMLLLEEKTFRAVFTENDRGAFCHTFNGEEIIQIFDYANTIDFFIIEYFLEGEVGYIFLEDGYLIIPMELELRITEKTPYVKLCKVSDSQTFPTNSDETDNTLLSWRIG